jgi:hypothetical protein
VTYIDPSDVHYRLVLNNGKAVVATVQDFDYPDYVFATPELYSDKNYAEHMALNYNVLRRTQKVAEQRSDAMLKEIDNWATTPKYKPELLDYTATGAVFKDKFDSIWVKLHSGGWAVETDGCTLIFDNRKLLEYTEHEGEMLSYGGY